MNPHVVFEILIALGVVWTAVWATALVRSQRVIPFATIATPLKRLQIVLLVAFLAIGTTAFIVMLYWLGTTTLDDFVAQLATPEQCG